MRDHNHHINATLNLIDISPTVDLVSDTIVTTHHLTENLQCFCGYKGDYVVHLTYVTQEALITEINILAEQGQLGDWT